MAKVGRPTLTQEEADRVVQAMRDLLPKYDRNNAELGRALGIKGQAVGMILNQRHKPSFETAKKVAELAGVDWAVLVGGKVAAIADAPADPYPLRRELRLLSEFRSAPAAVQAAVLAS